MFYCEICEIFKNTYFVEHLQKAAADGSESDESENDDESCNEGVEAVVRRYFFKIGVLKNFANCTGKHLCWSFLVIKLQALKPATLLKTDSNTGISYDICELLKNTFFTEHLRWLLLKIMNSSSYCQYLLQNCLTNSSRRNN